MTIIDTHQHNWDIGQFDYAWIKPGSPLAADYLPPDAHPLMLASGIEVCVLVEGGTHDPVELDWLLQLAHTHEHIIGVVGWLDLKSDVAARLARINLNHRAYLKGVRYSCFDPQDDWAALDRGLAVLADNNLTCDLLVGRDMLPHVAQLVGRHSDMRFILDHFAGARLTPGKAAEWSGQIADCAAQPNTSLKVSGFLTAAEPQPLAVQTLKTYLDIALDLFGPARLMYGSDWPVCTLGGTYPDTVTLLRQCISPTADLWANTARFVYNL